MSSGAVLFGDDNGCYMVASCDRQLFDAPDDVFCLACGWRTDRPYTRDTFRLGASRLDVSSTTDGDTIVSARISRLLAGYENADDVLVPLRDEPEFYHLVPWRVVKFDAERRGTRFGTQCETCGLFESVAGATPAFLKEDLPAEGHLFRTDVLFGSRNERRPLLLVSDSLRVELEDHGLTGLTLEAIG